MRRCLVWIVFLFLPGLLYAASLTSVTPTPDGFVVSTPHGTDEITEPLLVELIKCPAFQRLKKIIQHGTCDFHMPTDPTYCRFDHCLGVMMLMRQYGASVKDQASGLLHDVSHTAFSHSTEPLFIGGFTRGSYQDTIHTRFLQKHKVAEILERYGIQTEEMDPEHCLMLDRPKPELCADRLEYNLITGVLSGRYSLATMHWMESHLHYDPSMNGGQWYFDDIDAAQTLAESALIENMTRWSSAESILTGTWTSELLEEALRLRIVTVDDIQYAMDDMALWTLLKKEGNAFIQERIRWVENPNAYFDVIDDSQGQKRGRVIHSKFMGIDPLVKVDDAFHRLTELDPQFKRRLESVKTKMKEGWTVTFKNGARLTMKLSKHEAKAA